MATKALSRHAAWRAPSTASPNWPDAYRPVVAVLGEATDPRTVPAHHQPISVVPAAPRHDANYGGRGSAGVDSLTMWMMSDVEAMAFVAIVVIMWCWPRRLRSPSSSRNRTNVAAAASLPF